MNRNIKFLDCTFRDGGYYNAWDFPMDVIEQYLTAMSAINVNVVELGFRTIKNNGFKGATAYTTDDFLRNLNIPSSLSISVMVNAAELISDAPIEQALSFLFPESAAKSPVSIVRIACHYHEFFEVLPAAEWLKSLGFYVGFNLMQVSERSIDDLEKISLAASQSAIDVLYFADSLGNLQLADVERIIAVLSSHWKGELGIHAHDNLGMALQNSLFAMEKGATWIDSTVTGMGRGPGNVKTEYLALEMSYAKVKGCNVIPLMSLITRYFKPMQQKHGWGTNAYYYLAGKYGIHPTYVQTMLADFRFSDEDIIAVLEHLKDGAGRIFNPNTLDMARHFSSSEPGGSWAPKSMLQNRDVLLLGTGPGVMAHRLALERYIRQQKPIVIAMNAQSHITPELIDLRVACHPIRLLTDSLLLSKQPQPLITPVALLSPDILRELSGNTLLDYGLVISKDSYLFNDTYCEVPNSLVLSYALAICSSGMANRIFMAGFDGFAADDPRNIEIDTLLHDYSQQRLAVELVAVTPTRYKLNKKSIYSNTL